MNTERGYETGKLSEAEQEMIAAGLQQVVPLENKKPTRFAEGTNPNIQRVSGENLADISKELNASELVATRGDKNRMSGDVESSLQMVKQMSAERDPKKDVKEALADVRNLIETHNDPSVIASRKETASEEAGVVGDRIFAQVERDLQGKRVTGDSNASEQEVVSTKVKGEMDKLKTSRDLADQAVAAYAKAYAEYDPKAISKLYTGAESVADKLAAYDLTSVTKPPLTAALTAKGRKLRETYKQMRQIVENYNNLAEANK